MPSLGRNASFVIAVLTPTAAVASMSIPQHAPLFYDLEDNEDGESRDLFSASNSVDTDSNSRGQGGSGPQALSQARAQARSAAAPLAPLVRRDAVSMAPLHMAQSIDATVDNVDTTSGIEFGGPDMEFNGSEEDTSTYDETSAEARFPSDDREDSSIRTISPDESGSDEAATLWNGGDFLKPTFGSDDDGATFEWGPPKSDNDDDREDSSISTISLDESGSDVSSLNVLPFTPENVLSVINCYRSLHGADPLTWSHELETQSQDWAEPNMDGVCNENAVDSVNQNSPYEARANGPNDEELVSMGRSWRDAIEDWYAEYYGADRKTGGILNMDRDYAAYMMEEPYSSGNYLSFTALVWKHAKEVGCWHCKANDFLVCQIHSTDCSMYDGDEGEAACEDAIGCTFFDDTKLCRGGNCGTYDGRRQECNDAKGCMYAEASQLCRNANDAVNDGSYSENVGFSNDPSAEKWKTCRDGDIAASMVSTL